MKQQQNLSVREATKNDKKAIVAIHNSHVRGQNYSHENGFLLAQTTEDEFIERLSHKTRYFLAVNDDDSVLGFLAFSKPKISNEILNQIIWQDYEHSEKLMSDQHIYIEMVATKLDYMGKGIARFMYESLYEKFPNSLLSTFIVAKPIANERSMIFHQKQGFHPIGSLRYERFLDLENYESILMLKEF